LLARRESGEILPPALRRSCAFLPAHDRKNRVPFTSFPPQDILLSKQTPANMRGPPLLGETPLAVSKSRPATQ
jgi:hypothetical protein